jgi:hypothetical protein
MQISSWWSRTDWLSSGRQQVGGRKLGGIFDGMGVEISSDVGEYASDYQESGERQVIEISNLVSNCICNSFGFTRLTTV